MNIPIAYNNRVYFSSPSGNPYQHKMYNPNNQSTRLPYNMGQYYEEGTKKYYENLNGVNSTIFKTDNILGKTVYTEHGRPIVITEKESVKIPQVKYDYGIPVKSEWNHMDYCELDSEYIKKTTSEWFKNNFNIPLEKDIRAEYQPRNIDDGSLQPRMLTKENVENVVKEYDPAKIMDKYLEECDDCAEKFTSAKQIENRYRERFNSSTLNDTDILYREMIRTYAKAISFYLNNNPKYSYWKKNWKILENNLQKTNLLVERLSESDEDIAYTENKGEIIKFRWRDNNKYISKNIFMYVILHELTHQVFPPTFKGHGDPFPDMLCILCVAGLELDLFDLAKIPRSMIYTNGQPIGSKETLINELNRGIDILTEINPASKKYYDNLRYYVNSK